MGHQAEGCATRGRTLKRPAGATTKRVPGGRGLRDSAAVKKPRKHRKTVADVMEKLEEVNWVPLESNPAMFTAFARHIGLPEDWSFVDVLGIDSDLLCEAMVARPCVAVTLLFEYSDKILKAQSEQHAKLVAESAGEGQCKDVFFMRQFVGNACGTIAAIHCVANEGKVVGIDDDCPVGQLLAKMKGECPETIGVALAEMEDFHLASDECAEGGQTAAPEPEVATNHHFICFIEKAGKVVELNGVKARPIDHGPVGEDFLKSVAQIVKTQFMDRDPDNVQFNMMALVRQA